MLRHRCHHGEPEILIAIVVAVAVAVATENQIDHVETFRLANVIGTDVNSLMMMGAVVAVAPEIADHRVTLDIHNKAMALHLQVMATRHLVTELTALAMVVQACPLVGSSTLTRQLVVLIFATAPLAKPHGRRHLLQVPLTVVVVQAVCRQDGRKQEIRKVGRHTISIAPRTPHNGIHHELRVTGGAS